MREIRDNETSLARELVLGEFSITHWLIILVILLLFFGPSKLPGLGASLGKAIRGFKAGLNEVDPTADASANTRPDQLQSGAAQSAKVSETQKEKEPKG